MAANKTFQVSRKPEYKRKKPRSPLASLNEGRAVGERPVSHLSPVDDYSQKSKEKTALTSTQRQRSLSLLDQENIHHVQRNSPLVLLVPAGNMSASPDGKDLTKRLNVTLSPIGTPELFKKLMPRIRSDGQLTAADSVLTGTAALNLKDALALIDSDLSSINASPRDTNCSFSDPLESKSGGRNGLKALPDSPQGSESTEPRLTFFVSKGVVVSENGGEKVKKASFASSTVIKSRAPPLVESTHSSGRKNKKSWRRLLEKTLELSDGSDRRESGPGTPSLPVIHPDTETRGRKSSEIASPLCDDRHHAQEATPSGPTPPVTSPPPLAPARFSFSALTVPSLSPLGSSSPVHHASTQRASPALSEPAFVPDDPFPVHVAGTGKKRKSEEYLRSDAKVEDAGKAERVKRSKGVSGRAQPPRPAQERRGASQRQPPRTAGEQV